MYISILNIFNKPCQCRSTDYLAGDTLVEVLRVHQQRYRPSDSNKDEGFKFSTQYAFL